ncbi:DUF1804 family protein [Sulfurimonas sp.]|uniref:DUF1804 family protein n=1 Tax=Sulfurimonas sp. TaxID=2022749 RepID=UPI002B493D05|nr:DUF1804 family protein [Sulfurimonas sp.]
MTKKEKAKKFYVEDGYGVSEIAGLLQVERGTVYYYKNSDYKKSIDWDELRYIHTMNPKATEDKERMFLSVLIQEFDKALVELKESDIEEKLQKLESFAQTYYKLKIPDKKTNVKVQKTEIIKEVIKKISTIAIEEKHQEAAQFLSEHSERIVEDILRNA